MFVSAMAACRRSSDEWGGERENLPVFAKGPLDYFHVFHVFPTDHWQIIAIIFCHLGILDHFHGIWDQIYCDRTHDQIIPLNGGEKEGKSPENFRETLGLGW